MMVSRWGALVAVATGILLGTDFDNAQSLAQTRLSEFAPPADVFTTSQELAEVVTPRLADPELVWDATPEPPTDSFREASYAHGTCSTCCLDPCICGGYLPATTHCSGFFADAIYLCPGNVDITYAVEQTGCDPLLSSPTGPTGQVGPDAQLGFRTGFVHALSAIASGILGFGRETGRSSARILAC